MIWLLLWVCGKTRQRAVTISTKPGFNVAYWIIIIIAWLCWADWVNVFTPLLAHTMSLSPTIVCTEEGGHNMLVDHWPCNMRTGATHYCEWGPGPSSARGSWSDLEEFTLVFSDAKNGYNFNSENEMPETYLSYQLCVRTPLLLNGQRILFFLIFPTIV